MKETAKLKGFKLPTLHVLRHWFTTQAVMQFSLTGQTDHLIFQFAIFAEKKGRDMNWEVA